VRLHERVRKRVERELRREVEILVLARVHLAREVLHRRDAGVEVAELPHAHRIRALEDVALAERQFRVRARQRQQALLRQDGVPERHRRGASGKAATHADDGDRTIHVLWIVYHKTTGVWRAYWTEMEAW